MTSVIYFVQRADGAVKIGTTAYLAQRLSKLRSAEGDIKLLGIIKGSYFKEKILHWCLGESRIRGEWFEYDETIQSIVKEYTTMPKLKNRGRITKSIKKPDYYIPDVAREWIEREHGPGAWEQFQAYMATYNRAYDYCLSQTDGHGN